MRIQGRFRVDICRARSRNRDTAARIDFGAGNVQRAAVTRCVRNSVRGCRFGSTDFDCVGKFNSVVERCRAAFHRQRCSFRAGRCRERAAVLRNSAVESNAVVERNAPAVERDVEPADRRDDTNLRKGHIGAVDNNRVRANPATRDADAPAVEVNPAREFRLSRKCRRAAVLDKNRARRLAAQRGIAVKPDLAAALNDEASVVDEHAFLHEERSRPGNLENGIFLIQRKRVRVDGSADTAGRRFVRESAHREIDGGNGEHAGATRSRVFEFHPPIVVILGIGRAPKRVGLKRPARSARRCQELRHVPVGLFSRLNEHAFLAVRIDERNFQRIRKIDRRAVFVGQIKRDGDRFHGLRNQCFFLARRTDRRINGLRGYEPVSYFNVAHAVFHGVARACCFERFDFRRGFNRRVSDVANFIDETDGIDQAEAVIVVEPVAAFVFLPIAGGIHRGGDCIVVLVGRFYRVAAFLDVGFLCLVVFAVDIRRGAVPGRIGERVFRPSRVHHGANLLAERNDARDQRRGKRCAVARCVIVVFDGRARIGIRVGGQRGFRVVAERSRAVRGNDRRPRRGNENI